jgi:hypothetical protein
MGTRVHYHPLMTQTLESHWIKLFNIRPLFFRRTYTGLSFRKIAYTRYDVSWFAGQTYFIDVHIFEIQMHFLYFPLFLHCTDLLWQKFMIAIRSPIPVLCTSVFFRSVLLVLLIFPSSWTMLTGLQEFCSYSLATFVKASFFLCFTRRNWVLEICLGPFWFRKLWIFVCASRKIFSIIISQTC